jgi:predicted dehydrogenase
VVRTAILGLGNVAERIHLPACRGIDAIEVVAASEPREDRRREMQSRFEIPQVYEDSATLLESEDLDLAIIGTPPDSHRDLCLRSFESGADVFCEKPFVENLVEADEVIAAAKSRGRRLAVNTQYRHMAIYRDTRKAIARGDFGRPQTIQCWQQMFHPPQFEKLAWRARLERSTLFEFGTHALDLVCFLLGSLPTAISAHIPKVREEYDSDVVVQVTLGFPESRLATLFFNRVSHAPERYLEMRVDCEDASLRLSLGGVARAGVDLVRFRGARRIRPRFGMVRGGEARVEAGGRSWVLAQEKNMAFASATASRLEEFLGLRDAEGEISYADIEHARRILEVALTGYEAAECGRTLSLESD